MFCKRAPVLLPRYGYGLSLRLDRFWPVKARAAANPLAVMALAAGVGWRLFHRPPIATLLVGLGLAGLLRTSTSQADYDRAEDVFDPEEWRSRASGFADAAKQKVQDWTAQASQAAREAKTQVADTAASVAERASEMLRDTGDTARERLRETGDTARDRLTGLADDAASVSHRASARLRAAMPDRDDRDTILLGAAALAVAAAVGIAFSGGHREITDRRALARDAHQLRAAKFRDHSEDW
jgi:gas vesicle protein